MPHQEHAQDAGEPAGGARDAEWGPVLVLKSGGAAALADWELLSQPSLASHRSGTPPPCAPRSRLARSLKLATLARPHRRTDTLVKSLCTRARSCQSRFAPDHTCAGVSGSAGLAVLQLQQLNSIKMRQPGRSQGAGAWQGRRGGRRCRAGAGARGDHRCRGWRCVRVPHAAAPAGGRP